MFHRDTGPTSGPEEQTWDDPRIDRSRLSAALRLIFDGETADRIAAQVGKHASVDTAAVQIMRVATRQWQLTVLLSLLRRRRAINAAEPPLAPRWGAPARGTVALALHLELGLPIEALAEASNVRPDQLGAELCRARLNRDPNPYPACSDFVSSIGRYRDGSLDIGSRASLIQHAQHCDDCRMTLDRFQAFDARLLAQAERDRAALTPDSESSDSNWMAMHWRPVALVVGLLVTAIIGVGVYNVANHRAPRHTTTTSTSQLSGWLLTVDSSGSLTATDLATGSQRPVGIPGSNVSISSGGSVDVKLSPDHRLIARLQGVSIPRPQEQEIEIDTLDGKRLKSFTFASSFGQIVGWLGNDTILVVAHPEIASIDNQYAYAARLERESTLIAFDLTSGNQRQLFKGSVAQAYLSPDGTQIVLQTVFAFTLNDSLVFELIPFHNGNIGEPLVTISNGGSVEPLWAPDSSHVYLGVKRDAIPSTEASIATPAATPASASENVVTISIDRTGTIIQLPDILGSDSTIPIDISPDGQRLLRETITEQTPSPISQLWQTSATGADPQPLTEKSQGWFATAVWSPDSSTAIALKHQPFFLQPSASINHLGDISATSYIAIRQNGESFNAFSRLDDGTAASLIGWFPADTFPNLPTQGTPAPLSEPKAADLQPPNLRIDPDNQASPNSQYIVLTNPSTLQPIIWSQAVRLGRSLPAGIHDLSWFADSSALIGVGDPAGYQSFGANRISTFVPAFNVSLPPYDFGAYDPAGIGASVTSQYASPLISPNENTLAFFVIDARDHSVTLWLAGYGFSPKAVTHWVLPDNNRLPGGPIAGWINSETLLFAQPADWQDGLPDKIQLNRLTIEQNGTTRIDTAANLGTHGTEHGIAVEELAVSQQSDRIAYRLRHFTEVSITAGVVDTVEIASGNKIADALEVTRTSAATGLNWSPDGRMLATVSPGELDLFSDSGIPRGRLTGLTDAANPRWVNQNQFWFDELNDQGVRVVSVELH